MRIRALSTACTPLEVRLFFIFYFSKKKKKYQIRWKNMFRGRTIELEHTRWKVAIDRIGSQAKGIYIFIYMFIS